MADVSKGSGSDTGNNSSLFKGVVVEVLYDLGFFNEEKLTELGEKLKVKNTEELMRAPLNSCIVRPFGAGAEKGDSTLVVYPMFPPHIAMPVKPGECVWIMSPNTGAPSPKDSYWLCRISGGSSADDVNYTHWPRTFQNKAASQEEIPLSERQEAPPEKTSDVRKSVPGYPNTDGTGANILVPPETPGTGEKPQGGTDPQAEDSFGKIVSESETNKNIVVEPIAKYSKRPGDLVFQGSNNTLISLGQDRGWSFSDTSADIAKSQTSNASAKPAESTGTIDIVAGRSRYSPPKPMTLEEEGDSFERTNSRTVKNQREFVETLKNPVELGLDKNFAAGDPDLVVDASRILVSMKTSADVNFGISKDEKRIPAGFEATIDDVNDAAYVIAKSDEIRLIARKQEKNEQYKTADQPEINGSIRIIKEGLANEDLAAICLLPDGTIQVSGSKIFLGRSSIDGGAAGGPGPGASQPYVKYQDLEDLWNKTMDALNAFCDTLATHTTPGYGAPSPQILEAAATLKSEITSALKPEISNVQSERIFGE